MNNVLFSISFITFFLTFQKSIFLTYYFFPQVVLARCSRYITDTCIDPVELLACLKVYCPLPHAVVKSLVYEKIIL